MCTPHFGNGSVMGQLHYYYGPHYNGSSTYRGARCGSKQDVLELATLRCLGVEYKGLVFCRNNCWIMENMDSQYQNQPFNLLPFFLNGWMGADSPAENTPNASKNFSPKCLPKPKSWRFSKKKLFLGVRSPWLPASSDIEVEIVL